MNRIVAKFEELKAAERKGLVVYMTAGDPDRERSMRHLREGIESGIDILELGVPFSDPTADGPTIQAAAFRALGSGTTLPGVLSMVRELRDDFDVPVVLFGYANPFFSYGYEKLCADAASAGVDGLLAVDIPAEESGEIAAQATANDLCLVPLIAPTTPRDRLPTVTRYARGFVYYVMVKGVTGARETTAADVSTHVAQLREFTDLPVAVGFGVSSGYQAREVGRSADAVVVGSAVVRAAHGGGVGPLVSELSAALRTGA